MHLVMIGGSDAGISAALRARELDPAADVTVVAVRSGQTPMKALRGAVEILRRVNAPIAGIVLNQSAIATDVTYKAFSRYYST